jgi:hypothetical protein
MVGILWVTKAGWLSGVNNLKVIQYLSFIAFYSAAVLQICILSEQGKYSTVNMFTEVETQLLYKGQKKKLKSCGSVCNGSVT